MSRDGRCACVEVGQSSIHGRGLFARRPVSAGDLIGMYEGPEVEVDGMHVLWVEEGPDDWIGYDGTNCLKYLNHSAQPNAWMDGRTCYALRHIDSGEEITIDYGWDDA